MSTNITDLTPVLRASLEAQADKIRADVRATLAQAEAAFARADAHAQAEITERARGRQLEHKADELLRKLSDIERGAS